MSPTIFHVILEIRTSSSSVPASKYIFSVKALNESRPVLDGGLSMHGLDMIHVEMLTCHHGLELRVLNKEIIEL